MMGLRMYEGPILATAGDKDELVPYYHSKEIVENIQNIILANAEKYINNQPLINLVDFETGYKKSE